MEIFRFLIRDAAARAANRSSVLTDGHDECTYPEVEARIEAIQAFLAGHGVTPGQCVAVELTNSVRGALVLLALLDAGYGFMPMPAAGQGVRTGGARDAPVKLPAFAHASVTTRSERSGRPLRQCQPGDYIAVSTSPRHDSPSPEPAMGEPRVYFPTSGSLGTPKLASFGYQRFYGNVLNALSARGFGPAHRIALPTPIFHMYGLGAALLPAFAAGASVDLQGRSNLLRFLAREAEFAPNVAYVTPTFCEALVRVRRSPRRYEFMVTSGDRISDSAFGRSEELHGTMIGQYGSTEMGIVAASSAAMPYELRARTVGRVVPGIEVRIIPSPAGHVDEGGELQIRNVNGFDGYVDLTGRPLVPPGAFDGEWFRTGDLAKLGPDRTLMVLGRYDLSVNRNGMLLPLAEVESRMRELGRLDDVAVVLGKDTIRGRALIAFCTRRPGDSSDGAALREHFAAIAPAHTVPDEVRVLAELPRLPSGKVDRLALAALVESAT